VSRAPKRLLMTADAVGGVWTYAVDLARGLSDRGVRTTLAVLGPSPGAAQAACARAVPGLEMVETGLPLEWVEPDERKVRDASWRLAELSDRVRADLIQINSAALAAEDAFTVPIVVVAHSCVATWWSAVRGGAMPADFGWRSELVAEGYANADAVVAPSAAFAAATARAYDLDRAPIVVRNGRRAPVRLSRPMVDDFVFTAGRLWDEGKNIVVLDRAASQIQASMVAAGPLTGPHGQSARFEHLGTPGSLGPAQVAQLLNERPVFVSPALYEPFGLSVLEAAQAGCPLVLADIPTFRELWDGVADFFDPRDEQALATAVNGVLKSPNHRARLGELARLRARRYTAEAMAQGMLGVYRSIMTSEPSVRGVEVAA